MNIEDFNRIQTVLVTMNNDDVGELFESAFDKLYPNAKRVSKEDDRYKHHDRILGTCRCDIKSVKKKNRHDETFPTNEFLLEEAHVCIDDNNKEHYRKGWLHAEEMTHLVIGYITNNTFYFLIFDRDRLAKWCKKRYKKKDAVSRDKGEYVGYTYLDGVKCKWVKDLLLWVKEDPTKIDGFIKQIPIDDILQELLAEKEKI